MSSENGALLTRDAILQAALACEEVDCPEWGGKVRVRAMTSAENHAYTNAAASVYGKPKIKLGESFNRDTLVDVDLTKAPHLDLFAASMCIVDAEGKRLFKHYEDLGTSAPEPVKRCAAVARRLSGLEGIEDSLGKSSTTEEPASVSSSV